MTQSMVVGPVGLGVMDAPTARHLARMGHSLRLHDADMSVTPTLGTAAVACDTPAAPSRQGVAMVDAPMSGAQRGAEAVHLAFMAGGAESDLQRVLTCRFDDPFKVELMLKDIGIALELGREAQLPVPLSGLGPQLWRAAARVAGDGACVSEMPRWLEPPYGTSVTPGPGTDTMDAAAAAIPARNS